MSVTESVNLSKIDITLFNNIKSHTFKCSNPFEGEMILTEVTSLNRPDDPRVKRDPFALTFEADLACPPQQGIFTLFNSDLGNMEMFLVPIERTDDRIVFEAMFT